MNIRVSVYKLIFLQILFFFNCKSDKKNIELVTPRNSYENQFFKKKVFISGISDDPKAFESLNLINYSYFFSGDHRNTLKKIIEDTIFIELDSLKRPTIMRLYAFGDSTRYNSRVFVTPGDSIFFEIKNKSIKVSGSNLKQLTFFKEMESMNIEEYALEGSLSDYKTKSLKIFNRKIEFLNNYVEMYPYLSSEFIMEIRSDFRFEYLYNLLLIQKINDYKRETVFAIHSNNVTTIKEDNQFDEIEYFGDISLSEFKKPDLLGNQFFKDCLKNYIRYYYVNNDFKFFTAENFLKERNFILSNFNDQIRDFLITGLIYDYFNNLSLDNVDNIKLLLNEHKLEFPNSAYGKIVEEIDQSLNIINTKINEVTLKSELVDLNGAILTLRDIIKDDTIVVLDFWASWCKPCISEIKNEKRFKEDLAANYNVNWVYISIDSDKNKWIDMSKKLNTNFSSDNQYLILDYNESKIKSFFHIETIPRYIIIKGIKVVLGKTPRPSNNEKFQKIINDIKIH